MNSNQNPKQRILQIEELTNGTNQLSAEMPEQHGLLAPNGVPQPVIAEPFIPPRPCAYVSDPVDEFTNVCGELLDPLSVIRVTAHVSAAQPFGSIASAADQLFVEAHMERHGGNGADAVDVSGCMSFVRLGAGDQTVLLPSIHGTSWIPHPGIYELELMKLATPNVPGDVLVVQRFENAVSEPTATPWMLGHLGLDDALEADLHCVLASLKPLHQALLIAVLSRPDIEASLRTSTPRADGQQESPGHSFALRAGILAAVRMDVHDLSRDEASLVRLAAVLADVGVLDLPSKSPLAAPSSVPCSSGVEEAEQRRRAHPDTVQVLRAILNRLEALDPEDASRLCALWIGEGERPFRLGSRFGPLSRNPVDPDLARLGCALGDALGRARAEDHVHLPALLAADDGRGEGPRPSSDVVRGIRSRAMELALDPADAKNPMRETSRVASSKGESNATSGGAKDVARPSAPQRLAIFPRVELNDELMEAGWDALQDPNDISTPEGESSGEAFDEARGCGIGDALGDSGEAATLLQRIDSEALVRNPYSTSRVPSPSLDWAAGMLDGDGCIAIVKQPFRHRRSIYRLVVCVVQNCRQTLEHFQKCLNVPSTIYEVARKLQHNKQVYTLNYSGPNAQRMVKLLQDSLVRKRLEAAVALSFCEHGQISRRFGCHGVPAHIQSIRMAHYKKLRALK